MEKFVIDGRRRLSGSVTPSGNKNEALPCVWAATLLTDKPVILKNVPRIRDVEVMCDVLSRQGAQVTWHDRNTLEICNASLGLFPLDVDLCKRIRASILFAGPMVAKYGAWIYPRLVEMLLDDAVLIRTFKC